MKKSQLLIPVAVLALLLAANQLLEGPPVYGAYVGGVPWYGWAALAVFLISTGIAFAVRDARREHHLLEETVEEQADSNAQQNQLTKELIEKYDPAGPDYPHPVVIPDRGIGCEACVDACPHGVLAIVNNLAVPVARDQCAEDTSCQVECPVNPKACIVVNTTKVIKPRPVPVRNERFMTNVPGCYLIGDVSGTPMIKNAANEGADVIRHIAEELKNASPEPRAEYDVAIIGIGPAGLSAAVIAKQHGLKYVGIEQHKVLATIEAYPKNKYLFFKPDAMPVRGGLPVEGAGDQCKRILESWVGTMRASGVRINEGERCKAVKRATDGDYFTVETERGKKQPPLTYRARRVVLALGNHGAEKRLEVPGEERKVMRDGLAEDKVLYKLSNPDDFKRKKIVVVGGGNSAVEAAVDLVARRRGDEMEFRPPDEINEVTLLVRADFKNDVKLGNKRQVYRCIDEGKIKAYFGTGIKEIRAGEVVLMNSRTGEEKETIANDYVFALIGSDRPTKFLESIGIKIPES